MTKRTLLIDADVVAFKAAAALEEAFEWAPGYWTWSVSFDQVASRSIEIIETMKSKLDADRAVLCLTDPEHNFRLDILPSYKTHRKTTKKPLVLLHLKDWLVDNHDAKILPGLEGDDLMGILATMPSSDERVIVSIDKDMKTIPGQYVRTEDVVDSNGEPLIGAWEEVTISPEEAEYNHLSQTLTGDATDGYKGCPGIGPKKVDDIIELGAPIADNWAAVVAAFEKKKLSEEEALVQAQVARILHNSDYNMKTKEVTPWTP